MRKLEQANKTISELRTENSKLKQICKPTDDPSDPRIKYLLEKLNDANENISFLANENDILLNKYKAVMNREQSSPINIVSSKNESNTLELSRTNFNSPFIDQEKDDLIKEISKLRQELETSKKV